MHDKVNCPSAGRVRPQSLYVFVNHYRLPRLDRLDFLDPSRGITPSNRALAHPLAEFRAARFHLKHSVMFDEKPSAVRAVRSRTMTAEDTTARRTPENLPGAPK